MAELKKIAFVLDEFELDSPAQHLLDRFLAGYHRDGKWVLPKDRLVAVSIPDEQWNGELDRRVKDFGLRRTASLVEALQGAHGVVVAGKGVEGEANDLKLRFVVDRAPKGSSVFIYGAAGFDPSSVGRLRETARARQVAIASGSTVPVTWRLPELRIERGAKIKRVLAIVHGDFPSADFFGLEATLQVTGRRAVETTQREVGPELIVTERRWMVTGVESFTWTPDIKMMLERGKWEPLLEAALSRSNSPQGKSVEDGRTQDITNVDAFTAMIEHGRLIRVVEIDGFQMVVVVANGAVKDFTMAFEDEEGKVFSTQIYRPPAPTRNDFDRLVQVIEGMFETGKAPWPFVRSYQHANLLSILRYQSKYWYQEDAVEPPVTVEGALPNGAVPPSNDTPPKPR